MQDYDVVVAGAGIVGVSSALWLQKLGLRTAICDPNPPGSGTTHGPACTIATYACIPVNSPSVLTSLPTLLFSPDSPLSLNFGYALRHPRWMLSFLANCRQSRVEEITARLAELLAQTDAGLGPLIAEAGAEDLFVQNGFISVYSTKAGYEGAADSKRLRRKHGVTFEELGEAEVRTLEPELKLPVHRGLYFRNVRHVLNPEELARRFQARMLALGGAELRSAVNRVETEAGGVRVHLANGQSLSAGHVVIAAGAQSRTIRGAGTEQMPLGVERGYHISYAQHRDKISRPVGWAEGGFYSTPMALGLRFAGTVEINALDAPVNPRRIAYLKRRSHEMYGDLGEPDRQWLGFRPTMPDSLPVIGRAAGNPRVIHAFGHQHVGLTLGGITGRMVANLVQGNG